MNKLLITLCALTFLLLPQIAFCVPDLTLPTMDARAFALGRFFEHYKCPDENFQLIEHYIDAADKYQLDYRLLPAISLQESSCLKRYPPDTNNPWGWASARVGFESLQAGIDFVSERLANGRYYAGKTLDGKLQAYNPNLNYKLKIKLLMEQIETKR